MPGWVEGQLERYESGFCGIGGKWTSYSYFIKKNTLVQSVPTDKNNKNDIDLNGATIKLYPDESKPDEIHLTPIGKSVIMLRDASTRPSVPKTLFEWHSAVSQAISEAQKAPPPAAAGSGMSRFAAKGRSQYMLVPADGDDIEKQDQPPEPEEEEYPELWSVAVVRWNLGEEGKQFNVLSHGYDHTESKEPKDEEYAYSMLKKNSGPKIIKVLTKYSTKIKAGDQQIFTTKAALPGKDARYQAVCFYNCDPEILLGQIQLMSVIWCDTEPKEQGKPGGFGTAAALTFSNEVMDAFRLKFPKEADLTPSKCSSFDETLGEMIRKRQATKTKIQLWEDKNARNRAQKIDGMKLAEARTDKVGEVLENSEGLKDDADRFKDRSNTLQRKAWWETYKAIFRMVCIFLCFGGIIFALVYNFLGKPGSK